MRRNLGISAAATLVCAGALVGTPAGANTSIGVQIGVPAPVYVAPAPPYVAPAPVYVAPPPAAVYERTPAPRHGHIWVAGHWEWLGNRHVWVQGHFLRARAGYYYNQPQWVQHDGRWAYRGGGWARGDRDGDGVPNRFDRAPNNPHRR